MVKTEVMIPRSDFAKKERCSGNIIHQAMIAIHQPRIKELEAEVLARSTPGNPLYQQWMTFDEVSAYKRNEVGSNAVIEWLQQNNVQIDSMTRNREYITVSTTIANWEALLSTSFHMYEDLKPEYNHRQIPRASTYTIPSSLSTHIKGFMDIVQLPPMITKFGKKSNVVKEVTMLRKATANDKSRHRKLTTPYTCTTCTDLSLLNTFYDITTNNGNSALSQSVFETSGEDYSATDLTDFQQSFHITVQSAVDIGGHETATCSTNGCNEGNLDIQYIMGVSQLTVSTYYYVNGANPFNVWITEVANMLNPPLVNSISWGGPEQQYSSTDLDTFYTEAVALSAKGVTIMASSGDDGVSGSNCDCTVDSGSSSSSMNHVPEGGATWTGSGYFPNFPASCPYVTAGILIVIYIMCYWNNYMN